MFGYTPDLDGLILKGQTNVGTLRKLMAKLGKQALPKFLIDYIETVQPNGVGSLAIHNVRRFRKVRATIRRQSHVTKVSWVRLNVSPINFRRPCTT
jgi:hypothetical protein